MIKNFIKAKIIEKFNIPVYEQRIMNLKKCSFYPNKIVDIGAFKGNFTNLITKIYPNSEVLMIEPNPTAKELLSNICKNNDRLKFVSVAISSKEQEVQFLLEESNSRISEWKPEKSIMVKCRLLDNILEENNFENIDLIKIDVQGHELEVLKGATKTLKNTEVIICECSLIPIGGAPSIEEVFELMSLNDFKIYDIFGFNYRPLDNALWQVDVIFVKNNSNLLKSKAWN